MIHTCPMLDDAGLYLARMFEGDPQAMRWMLCHARHGRPADEDIAYMRAVAFCPGCGLDVRADLAWQVAGRPGMNALYERVQRAGLQAAAANRKGA